MALKVNAKNSEAKIIYTGETEITILENETIDVYLTLTPAENGTGSIRIFIIGEIIGSIFMKILYSHQMTILIFPMQ